jgi:hypothetical protein
MLAHKVFAPQQVEVKGFEPVVPALLVIDVEMVKNQNVADGLMRFSMIMVVTNDRSLPVR